MHRISSQNIYMSKGTKQENLIPKLRFKEFEGKWEEKKLSEIMSESQLPGSNGAIAKKITVKLWGKGVYPKVTNGSHNTKYYKRKAGQFIYSKLDFLNCSFGIIPDTLDGYESTVDLPAFDVDKKYSCQFLLERIKLKSFYKKLGETADGTRIARRVHANTFLGFRMSVPQLQEQKKIADFLTNIDNLIQNLKTQKDLLEKYKKGMMQKIFSQEVRFKDDDDKEFIPWKARKLTDVAQVSNGGTPSTNVQEYWNGGVEWFTPSELGSKFTSPSVRKISEMGLNHSSATICPPNSILLTTRATIGTASITTSNSTYNQGIHALIPKEDANYEYMYYWCSNIKRDLKRLANGTIFPEISGNELRKVKVDLPIALEQQKIADFLSSIDSLIELQKTQIEVASAWKKGLMQGMFA